MLEEIDKEQCLKDYGDGFNSPEEFAESYTFGNELTEGESMPEWGEMIKIGYLDILKGFGYDSFTLPQVIGAINKHVKDNPDIENRAEYTTAAKRPKYLSMLVDDGWITKGDDGKYTFVEGMIEAIEG